MTRDKALRGKNYVLTAIALLYFVYCKVFSVHLMNRNISYSHTELSRDIGIYLRENLIYIVFFLLFISVASTSFLLGYLIYHKFDRNRFASNTAVKAGLFFVCFAMYIITGTDALNVFSTHVNTFDYICDVSIMFAALAFISYASNLNKKKWLRIVDASFGIVILLIFVLAFLGVSGEILNNLIYGVTAAAIILMIICSFLHTRDINRKKTNTKLLFSVMGAMEMIMLIIAAMLLLLRHDRWYWLSFSTAVALMAYLVFNELVNMAARQYTNTAVAENYRKMAYVDKLCDIGNRNAFLQKQEETYDSDSLYYVVFDVNNLKRVNDNFGHSEGDIIIKTAARIIRDSFTEIGESYRIGGDEFSVIGQYQTAAEIEKALENMTEMISRFNKDSQSKLDLAYGYAIREDLETNTYELFNKADKAMYRYKHKAKKNQKHNERAAASGIDI